MRQGVWPPWGARLNFEFRNPPDALFINIKHGYYVLSTPKSLTYACKYHYFHNEPYMWLVNNASFLFRWIKPIYTGTSKAYMWLCCTWTATSTTSN
jgi:hypothetical protein